MSAFHSNHIKIHCGISYVNVEELVCKESVNEHTEMYVKLAIAQDTVHWLERNSLCEKNLNIKIEQQDMESVDYWGDIVSAQWNSGGVQNFVEITASSATKRMDRKAHTCVYQFVQTSYHMLVRDIAEKNQGTGIVTEGKEQIMQYPVVQYRETDWELLKRIAGKLNTVLMVNHKQDRPCFSVGCVKGKSIELEGLLGIRNHFSARKSGAWVKTWRNYNLGDQTKLNGQKAVVLKKHIQLNRGLLEFSYFLGKKDGFVTGDGGNKNIQGKSMRGRIASVQGERIELDFGASQRSVNRYYYMYEPASGNVMYAMPEVGSEAELYYPTEYESDAYVRCCFLPCQKYPDEAVKYFKTYNNKLFLMSPANVIMQAFMDDGEAQMVDLQNGMGITAAGTSQISITADEHVIISANASCNLNTTGAILVEQTSAENSILMTGNRIRMTGEYYEVSSGGLGGIRQRTLGGSCNMSAANQLILAALPMPECDEFTLQVLASIPQALSVKAFNSSVGYFR